MGDKNDIVKSFPRMLINIINSLDMTESQHEEFNPKYTWISAGMNGKKIERPAVCFKRDNT